jgi:hypothetical protein
MGLFDQKSLEGVAICLDAAVQALLRDRYSREKDLRQFLLESRQRLYRSGTPQAYFQRLVPFAYGIDGTDFDPLLPFLERCDEMWPYSESVEPHDQNGHPAVQSTQDLLMVAAAEGSMHEYFKPHPEVETWTEAMAARAVGLLRDHLEEAADGAQQMGPLLLGTAAALHDLLGGLAPYFQRVQQDRVRKEYSFVAHAIADVRRALLWTIVRDIRTELGGFLPGVEECLRLRVKRYALPARAEFTSLRIILERLATDLDDLAEIVSVLYSFDLLPSLASSLAGCPLPSPSENGHRGTEKVLPFGQVALVQTYGPQDEHVLYYTVDGVGHETQLAHSCADPDLGVEATLTPLLPAGTSGFTWENVLSCRVDDRGKVYFSPYDRLAAVPEGERYQEAARQIGRVEAACHRRLLQTWENYPDLFAHLDTHGPLVVVRTTAATVLLCRAEVVGEIQALRGGTPQEDHETRALLEQVRMRVQVPWAGFVLERRGKAVAESARGDERKLWRAKIRKQIERERIPNFRRLVEKLAPFGVHETTRGKGSHGTLRLPGGDGKTDRNQTTWYAIRHKAEPLPIPYVWETLERLGIGYEDFYQSLGGE